MAKSPAKSPRKSPPKSPASDPAENPGLGLVEEEEESSELLFDPEGCIRVRVERMDDFEKRWVMHGYLEPYEATEGRVADLFGGGKYRAKRLVADDKGRHVINKTRFFNLPGAYKPPSSMPGVGPKVTSGDGTVASPSPTTSAPSDRVGMNEALNMVLVNKVLEAVKASNEISRLPAAPSMDWGPIIIAGLGLVKELVTRPKSDPANDLVMRELEALQMKIERMKNEGPASNAIGDAVKAIRELIEVRDLIGGASGKDPDGAMWALGEKALGLLAERQGATPSQPSQPRQQPVDPNVPMWRRMLMHYRGQLLGAVSRGIEPDFAVDMSVRFLDPNLVGVAQEFFRRPDAAQIVVQVIPEMGNFPAWLHAYTEGMREAFTDSAEVVDDEEEEDEQPTEG